MRNLGLENVEESVMGDKLPAGGYVVSIVAVEDVPLNPGTGKGDYLWIVYDIKEGHIDGKLTSEYSGHYSDDWGKKNPWAHRFTRSYKESAIGMFKAFANRVEESNRGFAWNQCNEQELVGKEVGIVLQKELYTNDKGDDKERLNVVGVYASQDIRSGDFKMPEPKDNRTKVSVTAADVVPVDAYDDLPFS